MSRDEHCDESLPEVVRDYVDGVVKKIRYRKRVREEVREELVEHFGDALADCETAGERDELGRRLIGEFGDAGQLAKLIRRGKKRGRATWKKVVIAGFQAAAVFVVLFGFYTWSFVAGKPVVAVDYLEKLNEVGMQTPKESDNAWTFYQKANHRFMEITVPDERFRRIVFFELRYPELYNVDPLKVEEMQYERMGRSKSYFLKSVRRLNTSIGDLTVNDRLSLNTALKQYDDVLAIVKVASMKPYCRVQYIKPRENKMLINVLAFHLDWIPYFAHLTLWRARFLAEEGRIDAALEDCLTVIRMGRHFQNNFELEHRVATSICNKGMREMLGILATTPSHNPNCSHLATSIEALYSDGYPPISPEPQHLVVLDTIQHTFTQGGLGGGHLIPKQYASYEDILSINNAKTMFFQDYFNHDWPKAVGLTAYSLGHARREETLQMADRLRKKQQELVKLTPYVLYKINGDDRSYDLFEGLSRKRFGVLYDLMKETDRWINMWFRSRAICEATITILRLKQWVAEKGQYPQRLEELVDGGYLKALPADPYSDGALVYKQRDNNFILYSVGENFQDNGGISNVQNPWGNGKDKTDKIFWPVQ